MKTLITGFKSVVEASNASGILVSSLQDELPESLGAIVDNLVFRILDVKTHTLKEEITSILADVKPSNCIFIGQAPGYNRIALETIATNYRLTGPPAITGGSPQGDSIELDGPAAYMATLPEQLAIVARLNKAGIPANISFHGGNSLCNQILYHALHYASESPVDLKCGFLHIPALPEQVIERWPHNPFMPLEMSRMALEIVIHGIFSKGSVT